MDNLINETNQRLQEIIDNLTTIKKEYENKLGSSNKEIEVELGKVKKYKEDFFVAKQKIEKMNSDIEGFEADYQNLVDRFKDDELANILIAANKEISAKIDERKRKIAKDKVAMNELVEKAELSKDKLVKLTAEKRALELCLAKILDSYEFYTKALSQIIEYSKDNAGHLAACFHEQGEDIKLNFTKSVEEDNKQEEIENALKEEYIIEDNVVSEEIENPDEDMTIDDENDIEDNKTEDTKSANVNIDNPIINDDDDDEKIVAEDIKLDEEDITAEEENTEAKEDSKKGTKKRSKKDKKDEPKEEIEEPVNEEIIETDNYTIVVDEIPSVVYNIDDSIESEDNEKKD